jgi:hypothetical protein
MRHSTIQELQEHKKSACLCKNEKLICRISAILMSPNANQQIHWNQHHFPKEVEQEKVHREENAVIPRAPKVSEMEKARLVGYLVPGCYTASYSKEECQNYHQQAQAVQLPG